MTDSTIEGQQPKLAATASVISLHKAAQIIGSVATVVLVPRMLGVDEYGRFAFLLSLSYLGQILGDFGTLDVFGRFVPGMAFAEARWLYMRTLSFKLAVGTLCGVLTAVIALMLGDWMQLDWAILVGCGVALHIVAWVPFHLSLGLGRIGAWMTEKSWRQWVLLFGLLILYPLLGFTGALVALVIMEVAFCLLGLWWTRGYWLGDELRLSWLDYRPYVVAGLGFFLANVVVVALYRSGPVLVDALTGGEAAQVGFVDLAVGLFLMVYLTISQFALSLIPTLSRYRSEGQLGAFRSLLGGFMRIGLGLALLGALAVWLLADRLVPLIFGQDFGPAADAMRWISLGIPLAVVVWAGNVVATISGRGTVKFSASLAGLLLYLALSLLLVPDHGAAGAALGLSVAVLMQAAVLAVRLRPDFDLSVLWHTAPPA